MYSGPSLKRVLDQRWEGHLAAARAVNSSLQDIMDVLRACENKTGEAAVIASGLLSRLIELQFRFLATCMPDLLTKLDAPNKLLQSREASLEDAIEVITRVRETIVDMKGKDTFDCYWNQLMKDSTSPVRSKFVVSFDYSAVTSVAWAAGHIVSTSLHSQDEARENF